MIANVTEDDLKADGFNPYDCPLFRAIKRVDPNILYCIFDKYRRNDGKFVDIPKFASSKVQQHAAYQNNWSGGVKCEPFSFELTL